jgi:hypothetical protein
MRYFALATDYDGTLAHDGKVPDEILESLHALRESGRKILLVTGRELADLETVFPHFDFFDRIVAENGAVVYRPESKELRVLAERPPDDFIELLKARGVDPLSVGDVILATWEPHQQTVLDAIRDRGLEAQIIFNKGAVMVLPSGVNKRSGMVAALEEIDLSAHNVVGVGDAENDHAFLSACECAAAVSNALSAVKEAADLVTRGDHGWGVRELIDGLLADDLAHIEPRLDRHGILLGESDQGPVYVHPYGESVLIAGASGSGKSTLVTGLIERLAERKYQFCLIDPEGDYENLFGAVSLGNEKHAPAVEEIVQLLKRPDESVVVNLLGVALEDRPGYFASLLPRLQEMRAKTGRPHWMIVDEAHHMLSPSWAQASEQIPEVLKSTIFITVHPDKLARPVLDAVGVVVAVGSNPGEVLDSFARAVNSDSPGWHGDLEKGEALIWRQHNGGKPLRILAEPSTVEKRRHKRKYMQGALSDEEAFYFRGPEEKLNLKAPNLSTFMQLADGVDDETWKWHLRRGDYAKWFECCIKDPDLAKAAERIAAQDGDAAGTRDEVRREIEERYTAPAE